MVEYSKKLRVILPLLYTYDFGAPVWRIRLDAKGNRLVLEVRDTDLLLTDFYTLELNQKHLSKLPLPAAKNWWLGLEDGHEGLLLLHGYGDRQAGQHKGILAYSAATCSAATCALQWEQPELAFYGISKEGILALDLQDQSPLLLETQSGTILAANMSLEGCANAVANYNAERYQACTYPMLYLDSESYFLEVADFLKYKLQVEPVRGIEYAEIERHILISYYMESAEGNLDNFLCVFNLEGELQLQQRIAHGLSGIGSDTFIIFNLNLFFIQQRNTLVVYSLT